MAHRGPGERLDNDRACRAMLKAAMTIAEDNGGGQRC
jgi:hypothetical protein